MEFKILKELIKIFSFRNDTINIIKPFLENLQNNIKNETYNIQDETFISFLKSLPKYQIENLYNFQIINEEKYITFVPKKELLSTNPNEELLCEIIKGDRVEELQKFIADNDITQLKPIIKSFNEVKKMSIPIINYCVIQKARKCFKYLLINDGNPTQIMNELNPDINNKKWISEHRYEWDCMALAIYYGEVEIVKVLEERGIKNSYNPSNNEAAILSYRNSIVKRFLREVDEANISTILNRGLAESMKNNNIKAAEFFIEKGADVDSTGFHYQNILLQFENIMI